MERAALHQKIYKWNMRNWPRNHPQRSHLQPCHGPLDVHQSKAILRYTALKKGVTFCFNSKTIIG